MLALQLARRGVPCRIIDNDPRPGFASRAIALHARTLEFYQQLGFADDVVARGVRMDRMELRRANRPVAALLLRDMGKCLSPFPFMLNFPQDVHEEFLVERLRQAGVSVDWNVMLKDLTQDADGVRVTLEHSTREPTDREELCDVAYVCGCDGARSQVRHSLGISFPGGTYEQIFYVADVTTATAYSADGLINLEANEFVLMLPVRVSGTHRLVGIIPPDLKDKPGLSFEDLRLSVERMLDIKIADVNWFATYHVHHRVADTFRVGRCFLAGDAGHIHSPAGGQGMNTGIGDAVNLAWKLAQVLQGRANPALLDTYEPERIAFARTLVATTDRAFRRLAGATLSSRILRSWIIPKVLPLLTRSAAFRDFAFRTVSQIRINYRHSALSRGQAGGIRGGDRLPWVRSGATDNFAVLKSLDWQVHVYGTVEPEFLAALPDAKLPVHQFVWSTEAETAGLQRHAAYLVRPDGYVALASNQQDAAAIRQLSTDWALQFSGPAASVHVAT
jgi:2-polyprenyl-6-methoxyphenol hydroxylase-like FAD-dependent oxidoreductase